MQAEASQIKVNLNKQENIYILLFTDNGMGINDSEKNKIFDEHFTRRIKEWV